MADDRFNPDANEIPHLSCREWTVLKKHVIARAHQERARLLRRYAARTGRAFRMAWSRARGPFFAAVRGFVARQRQLAALRQLASMSDRELRDIGISRLEITAAVRSDSPWPRDDRPPLRMQVTLGENHAEGLLDCPRLYS